MEQVVQTIRTQLGEAAFASLKVDGRAMTMVEAIHFALEC
jgi:hypothetical protein